MWWESLDYSDLEVFGNSRYRSAAEGNTAKGICTQKGLMMAKKKKKKKGKKKVARRGVNVDKAREKADELDARFAGSYHELKEGPNWFYILPPWEGSDIAWEEIQQHGINVCRKTRGKKTCYGCDRVKQEEKRGNEKFVKKWRRSTKGLFNAIRKADLKKKDPDSVKKLRVSGRVFQEILEEIIDVQDITVPDAAVLVCIRRKGSGLGTRYTVKFGKETDLSKLLPDAVLNGAYDLVAAVEVPSDKEIKKAMRKAADDDDDTDEDDFADDDDDTESDDDGEEDEGDEDDEFSDDDEDEDDEEEDEDSDDDDEEEDEEEEEDDEEEEDEDEEPPPKKKKKKVKKGKGKKKSKKKRKKK